jgi:N-acetylneuraminic acid mutarotase
MRTIKRHVLSGILLCLSAFAATVLTAGAQGTAPNEWTWQGGSTTCCQAGIYGAEGAFAAGNIPSSRYLPATATDIQRNFWLFGGAGSSDVSLNDLWEFNPTTRQWVWVNGSNTGAAPGNWGVMGTFAPSNIPGGRTSAAAWSDSNGNFWLFGGYGADSNNISGRLNDLWEFSSSTKLWAWMAGSSSMSCFFNSLNEKVCDQPATSSSPGGREGAVTWTDSQGNLWLFGGFSSDYLGTPGNFNDFWEYSTSSNAWTFMGGASQITCINPAEGYCVGSESPQPQYGSLGVPAAGNNPGGRTNAAGWTDSSGNLWIFGGENSISTSPLTENPVYFSDVWKYDFASSEWTWMAGPNGSNDVSSGINDSPGVYGILGVPAAANTPGGRTYQNTWTDKAGNFWLFGGEFQIENSGIAFLNDLWVFNPNNVSWTWIGGSTTPGSVTQDGYSGQAANYGALGIAAAGNTPGGRANAGAWADSAGNFWLFGGGNSYVDTPYNDWWEYQPSANSLPPAITPAFTPAAGSYTSTQAVTISNGMVNAAIYYTTDGSTPSSASILYTSPVAVAATETLNAIAIASGYPNSGVGSALFTLHPPVATPTFGPASGTYGNVPLLVSLSDTTPGATIYYTTDGSTPTTSSTVYTNPIPVSATETLNAFATAAGYSVSAVANAVYTIPSFSLAGTAVSVAPGATTGNTSTITLSPSNGFAGVINLSCAITPTAASNPATCIIPASATINGASAQTITLTVYTTAATSALLRDRGFFWRSASGAALACILFAGIPSRRRRWWSTLGMVVALFCIVGGALGCGGGSNPSTGGYGIPSTTPGTYVITVTGTSGSSTQMGTISLIVK